MFFVGDGRMPTELFSCPMHDSEYSIVARNENIFFIVEGWVSIEFLYVLGESSNVQSAILAFGKRYCLDWS